MLYVAQLKRLCILFLSTTSNGGSETARPNALEHNKDNLSSDKFVVVTENH